MQESVGSWNDELSGTYRAARKFPPGRGLMFLGSTQCPTEQACRPGGLGMVCSLDKEIALEPQDNHSHHHHVSHVSVDFPLSGGTPSPEVFEGKNHGPYPRHR